MLATYRHALRAVRLRRGLIAVALALGSGLAACGPRVVPPAAPIEVPDRAFLLSPTQGFPLPADAAEAPEVERAHAWLIERGDTELAVAVARRLQIAQVALPVAEVLAAQASFVAGRDDEARTRLAPLVAAHPDYAAAQLLWGRLAERAGDPVTAVLAYRALPDVPLAVARATTLAPEALARVRDDFRSALERGRVPDAETALVRLREWAPAAVETVQAERDLAAAKDDTVGELAALRRLARLRPDDVELAERHAVLEVTAGDPGRGVRIFERLAESQPGHPDSARRREQLQWAKFQWRLTLLPPAVRSVAARPQLDRADLATLLYWVAPGVRRSRAAAAGIASDVLDHPRREEIVRVVNLGLMDLDETLHRFYPGQFASRGDALRAVVLWIATGRRPLQCVAGVGGSRTLSRESVCAAASGCGLLPSSAECLPGTPVSGAEALEWLRLASDLMGEE